MALPIAAALSSLFGRLGAMGLSRVGVKMQMDSVSRKAAQRLMDFSKDTMDDASRNGLLDGAKKVFKRSQQLVPREVTRELYDSAYIKQLGKGFTVDIGYSAPHAKRTHENPRAGKTRGISPSGRHYHKWATKGQWKWLETAVIEKEPDVTKTIVKTVTSYLEGK